MSRPPAASPAMESVGRRAGSLLALVILLAPVSITLLWHFNNAGWPWDDAASYMETAYSHYLALTNGTLEDGLRSIYRNRGWRPIFFPALAAPFLWLTGGNVPATVAGVLVGCMLVWSAYAYGIARQYVAPIPAALAAALACTAPRLLSTAVVFFAEGAWLAACAAFVYHALRSEDFRNRWHGLGAGIALAIAVLLRPAETVATMGLPVIAILVLAVRRGTVGRRDVIVAMLQVGITATVLAAAAFSPYLDSRKIWPLCTVLVMAGIFVGRRRPTAGGAGLALCAAAIVALNAWWWADFMPQLFSWVYATSFGAMARITDVRAAELGFAGLLGWLGQRFVSPPTALVGALAVLVTAVGLTRQQVAPSGAKRPWDLLLIALGALLPMLVLYGLTGTSDTRRLLGGAFFTVLVAAIVAMANGPLHRLRIAIAGAAVLAQLLLFLAFARGDTGTINALLPWVRNELPAPRPQADPHLEFVRKLLDAGVPRRSGVAIYTMALHNVPARVWEPAAAMLASRTLRYPVQLTYNWEIGDYDKTLAFYRAENVEYLAIELFRDPRNPAPHQPYIQFAAALLDKIDAGQGDPRGLELLGRFELGGRQNAVYRIVARPRS